MDPREDKEEGEVMSINDPRVPETVRTHAARFDTPVCFVMAVGENIVLTAEDGAVVDICSIT
jgi:hypothetical protein